MGRQTLIKKTALIRINISEHFNRRNWDNQLKAAAEASVGVIERYCVFKS